MQPDHIKRCKKTCLHAYDTTWHSIFNYSS